MFRVSSFNEPLVRKGVAAWGFLTRETSEIDSVSRLQCSAEPFHGSVP